MILKVYEWVWCHYRDLHEREASRLGIRGPQGGRGIGQAEVFKKSVTSLHSECEEGATCQRVRDSGRSSKDTEMILV